MIKTKTQKAFTSVELMVGMIAVAIVILATGTILVASQNFLNDATAKTKLQRDASYAMLTMNQAIRAAGSAEIEAEGKAVKIYRETGWVTFSAANETKSLTREIQGQQPHAIITGTVENLDFTVQGNTVGIDLALKDGNFENRIVSTVMIRNN